MKIKNNTNITLSILLHFGIIAVFAIASFVSKPKINDLSYVEVSFGLNQDLVQTRQKIAKKEPVGEREALKAKDALPQLTKNSAPNVAQKPEPKEDVLKFKSKSKETKNTTKEVKKTVKETPKLQANKSGKLETKEFLKRKEEELRKIEDKAQTGQKKLSQDSKIGQKQSLDDLPRSPFETVKSEKAPASEAPTGDETGQSTEATDAYKMYLRAQLKRHWNLPDVTKFSLSLIAIVSFTVNEYGYLSGTPKIVESSHNQEFDRLVLEAITSTFPVSNPPPKEIRPPQTFLAKYNSKDVR